MRTREENMSIAALVCAIVGLVCSCGPCSIAAIVLGAMTFKKVLGGYKTMAMVGLIGGIVVVAINVIAYVAGIPMMMAMLESM